MLEDKILGYYFWDNSDLITMEERVDMLERMYEDIVVPDEYKKLILEEVYRNRITCYLKEKTDALIKQRTPPKKTKKKVI